MNTRSFARPSLAAVVLAGCLGCLAGCETLGFVAHVAGGGEGPPIEVTAEYDGLDDQKVAVLVNADLPVLYQFPHAPLEITSAVNAQLADGVPGIELVNARDVVEYQHRNIYWNTATPAELMDNLDVTRLVMIDLIEFRTHEPGNTMVYRGVISARVKVFEADAAQPNNPTYGNVVSASYPPDRPEGVPEANAEAIRKGALDLFARAVAGKFHDHKVNRGRR